MEDVAEAETRAHLGYLEPRCLGRRWVVGPRLPLRSEEHSKGHSELPVGASCWLPVPREDGSAG